MQRPGQIGMMQGTTVHPALPFVSATKLVKHVVAAAEHPPIACAALTGMCEWVRGLPESELEADFGAELAEAVGGSRQSAYRAIVLLARDGHLVKTPAAGGKSTYETPTS